eukprot:m.82792 g.82792  ORF g.82792 m.82792 type:complete len:52 (+) comp13419_c0_seq5:578-733(+)
MVVAASFHAYFRTLAFAFARCSLCEYTKILCFISLIKTTHNTSSWPLKTTK